MTNLCFMTNLNSNDWAAWVQAIGSVIAIFVAIGLAYWQWCQAQYAVLEKKKAQFWLGTHFVKEINSIFDEAFIAGQAQNVNELNKLAKKVADMLEWSRTYNLDGYDVEMMHSFVKIRSSAADLIVWAHDVRALLHNSGAVFVKRTYMQFVDELPKWATRMHEWALSESSMD